MNKQITVVYTQDDSGKFAGFVPNLPAVVCQADTLDQLMDRIKAAHQRYVSFLAQKEEIVAKSF